MILMLLIRNILCSADEFETPVFFYLFLIFDNLDISQHFCPWDHLQFLHSCISCHYNFLHLVGFFLSEIRSFHDTVRLSERAAGSPPLSGHPMDENSWSWFFFLVSIRSGEQSCDMLLLWINRIDWRAAFQKKVLTTFQISFKASIQELENWVGAEETGDGEGGGEAFQDYFWGCVDNVNLG